MRRNPLAGNLLPDFSMLTIFGFSALIVVLDQATKFLAVHLLKPVGQVILIPDMFQLSYVQNTGIAFGLFQEMPSVWTLLISISIFALLIGTVWFRAQPVGRKISYSFILGGAAGNWIDRIRLHYVVDFLDFRIWPVFNIADSFITIGILLFIYFTWKGR